MGLVKRSLTSLLGASEMQARCGCTTCEQTVIIAAEAPSTIYEVGSLCVAPGADASAEFVNGGVIRVVHSDQVEMLRAQLGRS